MSKDFQFEDLPYSSFIFWPVGCGDSTTIVIDRETVVQVDLNSLDSASEADNERIDVVAELVSKLPRRNGKPYLACFILSHPDLDHCRGFARLLKSVVIGELWHTPRVLREYRSALSDDAKAFWNEARRRARRMIETKGTAPAGDRVRVIGYDELLQEDRYQGFPLSAFTMPGRSIGVVDGKDVSDRFFAFVHAPFKDDSAGERNETSLALWLIVKCGKGYGRLLLLGDLSYPTLRRVFDETKSHGNEAMIKWDAALSPHHCSKKVMYVKDESGVDQLKQDILDDLEAAQGPRGYIIASSAAIPGTNTSGDNPPHAKARNRYEEIATGGFICTGEYSTPENLRPIVLEVREQGLFLRDEEFPVAESTTKSLATAIATARGDSTPPAQKVGFGFAG